MIPATHDISIYKGDGYELFFRVRSKNTDGTPGAYVDLTGATVLSQIKLTKDDPDPLLTFTPTIPADTPETRGSVLLALTGVETSGIAGTPKAVYDVQITKPGEEPDTYLAGAVTFIGDVSR